jgi:hypothetical protein
MHRTALPCLAVCHFAGFSKEPQGASCKTVFITGYMASYLLYTWFAAGVTSLLAVQGQHTHLQLSDVAQMGTDFSASWDGLLPDFFMVRSLRNLTTSCWSLPQQQINTAQSV